MNTVTITGNVTDKPSSGTTDAGTQYCRFAVAVSRKIRKDGGWEDKLDGYFKVVAWRTLAESCSKAIIKATGDPMGSAHARGHCPSCRSVRFAFWRFT